MRANGIEIPRQVQVIGFDNIEESQYLQIPLTTMDSRLEWTAAYRRRADSRAHPR